VATTVNVPADQTAWNQTDLNKLADGVVELQGIANGGSRTARLASELDGMEPFYAGHRGTCFLYPENTVEGYLATLAGGHPVMKAGDYRKLKDGNLGDMHDDTLDRTTSSSGNVSDQTIGSWRALQVDASTWLAPNWPNYPAPLIDDVLSALQGRALPVMEAKSADGSGALLAAAITRWGLQKNVIVQSFFNTELVAPLAAGITCGYVSQSATPSLANAAGCKYIIVDHRAVSDAWIPTALAAGFKVLVWTVNDRGTRDHYLPLGVSGFFTDDPAWLDATLVLLTTDPFATQTFYSGMIPSTFNAHADTSDDLYYRGKFLGGTRWGLDSNATAWVCMGFLELGAAPPATWHLQATLTYDRISATGDRHPGIAFCATADQFSEANQGSGYYVFLRENGQLELFKQTNGAAVQVGATVNTAAITAGNTAVIKIDVTAASITVTRTDVVAPNSITANDATFRGRYIHFGKNGDCGTSFSAVTRT
jgi:glycerophosphoryl diester phosphodiesterase